MHVQEESHSKSKERQHFRLKEACLVSYRHNNATSGYIQSIHYQRQHRAQRLCK